VNDGKLVGQLEGTSFLLNSLAISPDGNFIVTGSSYLLDFRQTLTGKSLCTLSAHGQTVFSVAISPDGKLIVTGGYDGVARIWQAPDGHLVREIKLSCGGSAMVR
jgi:WD40 repeat protein